ncbi:hypothetical protein OH807_38710 [Kitasatospora sp. NBC_01560]|uniref:hypothetical protein n=1 Tax=Kitasatospora sp. NBC_01560 TaxID=2975965 RepID=UPI003866B5D6
MRWAAPIRSITGCSATARHAGAAAAGPSAPRAPERKAEPGNPGGGGTVLLGVAWYDRAFFDDRRDAWFGAMHQRIHKDPGIPLEDITVTHWQLLAS